MQDVSCSAEWLASGANAPDRDCQRRLFTPPSPALVIAENEEAAAGNALASRGSVPGAPTVPIPIRRYTPEVRAQGDEVVIAAARDLSQQLGAG